MSAAMSESDGSAAEVAEEGRLLKYANLPSDFIFQLLAFDRDTCTTQLQFLRTFGSRVSEAS